MNQEFTQVNRVFPKITSNLKLLDGVTPSLRVNPEIFELRLDNGACAGVKRLIWTGCIKSLPLDKGATRTNSPVS